MFATISEVFDVVPCDFEYGQRAENGATNRDQDFFPA